MKLLILLIDCLDYQYLMENLDSLESWQYLDNCYHCESKRPTSLPAWSTFLTGKSYEEHGIKYTVHRDNDPANRQDIQAQQGDFIWNKLNELGLSVSLFHVPMTAPAFELDGTAMCGGKFHGLSCYPKDIKDYVFRWMQAGNRQFLKFNRYQNWYCENDDPEEFLDKFSDFKEEYIQKEHFSAGSLVNASYQRLNLMRELTGKANSDVAIYYDASRDNVNHAFYSEDARLIHLENLGKAISQTVNNVKPENFIIVSDHGAAKIDRKDVYIEKDALTNGETPDWYSVDNHTLIHHGDNFSWRRHSPHGTFAFKGADIEFALNDENFEKLTLQDIHGLIERTAKKITGQDTQAEKNKVVAQLGDLGYL